MTAAPGRRTNAVISHIVLFACAAVSVYVRLRFIDMPFDRDEGGWAYAGSLILDGIQPYTGFYNLKMPGTYYMYAFIFAVAGKSIAAIKAGLLAINLFSAALVYFLSSKNYGKTAAASGTALFLLFTLTVSTEGFSANTEHFAVFFILLSLCAAEMYAGSRGGLAWIFISGAAGGAAFLCKQPAVLFTVFVILYIAFRDGKKPAKTAWATGLAGFLIPVFVVLLDIILSGAFEKFRTMVFEYALIYAGRVDAVTGFNLLLKNSKWLVFKFAPFIILAAAGAALIKEKKAAVMPALLLLVSAVVVSAGFYFRPHYFIFFAPAAAIAAACAYNAIERISLPAGRVLPIVLVFCTVFYMFMDSRYLFKTDMKSLVKDYHGPSPVLESLEIARYIKENSAASDTVAVLGSEPQILFYAGRKSATGHVYGMDMTTGALAKKMQAEAVSEIEKAEPEYLVFVNIMISWLLLPDSERGIFHWYEKYRGEYYEKTGVVHIKGKDETVYFWGSDAKSYVPDTGDYVDIYRRVKR